MITRFSPAWVHLATVPRPHRTQFRRHRRQRRVGNAVGGIDVAGDSGSVIRDTCVSGNGYSGIKYSVGAINTTVTDNRVGTNATGTSALPNSYAGITLDGPTTTLNTVAHNLCSGNATAGIVVASGSHHNAIRANLVGSDVGGICLCRTVGTGFPLGTRDAERDRRGCARCRGIRLWRTVARVSVSSAYRTPYRATGSAQFRHGVGAGNAFTESRPTSEAANDTIGGRLSGTERDRLQHRRRRAGRGDR